MLGKACPGIKVSIDSIYQYLSFVSSINFEQKVSNGGFTCTRLPYNSNPLFLFYCEGKIPKQIFISIRIFKTNIFEFNIPFNLTFISNNRLIL